MKKRLFFISLILALVMTTLMPGAALAAKPESPVASGVITSISPTSLYENVFPVGNSGRWRVIDREIGGQFVSGAIGGPFTLTYKANVDENQVGVLHGTLVAGSYTLQVNGKIEPVVPEWVTLSQDYDLQPLLDFLVLNPDWQIFPEYIPAVLQNGTLPAGTWILPKLTITGRWTVIEGAKGNGDFKADVFFVGVQDPLGNKHVGYILWNESPFTLTGKWQ